MPHIKESILLLSRNISKKINTLYKKYKKYFIKTIYTWLPAKKGSEVIRYIKELIKIKPIIMVTVAM